MARYPKPVEGSWTEHYPQLDTGTISYEDSISPEWYEREREAIFKRTWLNVGRVERLPRTGSYFTKELPSAGKGMSVIVVKMGPEASAGSCPSALRPSGIRPPKQTAISVLAARETATTQPSVTLPFHAQATNPSRTPSTMPLIIPTSASLRNTRHASYGLMIPNVSSRKLTATD